MSDNNIRLILGKNELNKEEIVKLLSNMSPGVMSMLLEKMAASDMSFELIRKINSLNHEQQEQLYDMMHQNGLI